jgi:predicted DNA-binding WGR domain protein
MRRFELTEGTSNKFWEIEVADTSVTTRYGRVGAAKPQSTTKSFATPAAAAKEAAKLVSEKTKKGYIEQAVGGVASTAAPAAPRAKPGAAKRVVGTKTVKVALSEFRAPGRVPIVKLKSRPEPACEIAHWPGAGAVSASFTERDIVVTDDGAVLTVRDQQVQLFQRGARGEMTAVQLNHEREALALEPHAAFTGDGKPVVLGRHVEVFDADGTRAGIVRGDGKQESYEPLERVRDGRILAFHAKLVGEGTDLRWIKELVLDPLGDHLAFAGTAEFPAGCAIDEKLDLVVTSTSFAGRQVDKKGMQVWSLSRRERTASMWFSEFPGYAWSVAVVAHARGARIVLLASSCLFVTDAEGATHYAVQLQNASTLLPLPGARIAVDSQPPMIFDVLKNQLVASPDVGGWRALGIPGTTRALLADKDQRQLGLVDFATSTLWMPVAQPAATRLASLGASPNGTFVALLPGRDGFDGSPIVLRMPST